MRRLRGAAGSALIVAAAAAAMLAGGGAADQEAIYIGVAGPVNHENGRSMQRAAEMAVDEINRAGGINGRRLALVVKDDQARPERAIEVAVELRDDPRIVAVVGHVNSAATLAAATVYNHGQRPVLQISPASSSPLVSDAGRWTFRVCPSDLQHGPALADWAYQELGARRAAILYVNDEYGRGVLESFGSAFENAGGSVISRDPYLPTLFDSDDALDPYLLRAIRDSLDALFIAGQADAAAGIIRAARRLGYRGPVLGPDGLTGLKDAGSLAEGTYISSAFLPDRPSTLAQTFVREYVERFEELPDHRGAMAYDAVHLIARGLAAVGPNRAALRDYIAGVGNGGSAPYDGVSGTIAFDDKGDVAGKEVVVGVVRDGQLVTAVR